MGTEARRLKARGMGGFSIGRVAGIDILVHWSWLVIFGLLTWSLAEGLFLHDYPSWTRGEAWLAGAATSLVLFGCVLLHELSHSLMARSKGIDVASITLFIFGGVSGLTKEPERPGQEFIIAIVGPLTSFVLAGLFGLGGLVLSGGIGTAFLYLAAINAGLGVFNLLPGFPLDGGRVLRALAWARDGSLVKATRLASQAGKVMAVLLMAGGAVAAVLGAFTTGVWFLVIGWFLFSQADISYKQVLARRVLSHIPVRSALSSDFHAVEPDLSLSDFLSDYVLTSHQRSYPVMSGDRLVGLASLPDLRKYPKDEWHNRILSEAMTPLERLRTVSPTDDLQKAAEDMASADVHQLPVMDDGRFLGFVTRADIIRLVRVRSDLGGAEIERLARDADEVAPRS
jgi:Zn-dependent protease/CBS domain-containing protein